LRGHLNRRRLDIPFQEDIYSIIEKLKGILRYPLIPGCSACTALPRPLGATGKPQRIG